MEHKNDWIEGFIGAITVCDVNGVVLEMNDASASVFEANGGYAMIGKEMFSCHSPASQEKLKSMIANQKSNVYTIEKHGQKKLIYQHPWYKDGQFAGFVEISLPIPDEMPHFVRG